MGSLIFRMTTFFSCLKGSLFGDRPARSVQVYPEKDHGYLRALPMVSKSTSMIFVGEQENIHKFSPVGSM